MSRTFSMKKGSVDNLKPRLRWGCTNPKEFAAIVRNEITKWIRPAAAVQVKVD